MSRHAALEPSASEAEQPQGHSHVTVQSPELLTQAGVCRKLGISADTWTRWRKAGRTPDPVVMPSGRRRWRVDVIDEFAGKPTPIERVERRRHFSSVVRHSGKSAARLA